MNKASIDERFKERKPLETVEIIKNIFKELSPNFTIEIVAKGKPHKNINMFWHSVELKYDDILVAAANGKGMTEEYSLASAFGELYEKFTSCHSELEINGVSSFNDDDKYMFISKNQKKITFDEVYKHLPESVNVFDKNSLKTLLEKTYGVPVGYPYKNIAKKDEVIYLDPGYIFALTGNNGVSAGNTISEALNQGISEMVERYAQFGILNEEFSLQEIDISFIKAEAPESFEKIKEIKSNGFDVKCYIVDQKQKLPVVTTVIIDKKRMRHFFKFGCFPVFSVALERTLTEVFQGRNINGDFFIRTRPYVFFKNEKNKIAIYRNGGTGYYPDRIFDTEKVYDLEDEIFMQKNSSNDEVLEYWKNFANKRNINIYYTDLSIDEKMASVWTYSEELSKHLMLLNPDVDVDLLEKVEVLINELKEERLSMYNTIKQIDLIKKIIMHENALMLFISKIANFNCAPIIDYVKATLLYTIGQLGESAEHFGPEIVHHLFSNDIESKKILEFITFIEYKEIGVYSDDEIKNVLSLYGSEDSFEILNEGGKKFKEKYIKNVLFGDAFEKECAIKKEIKEKIAKRRDELLKNEINL